MPSFDRNTLPLATLHEFVVESIDGPLKEFNSQEGRRVKYVVVFNNGYQAEYCPLINDIAPIPTPGSTITFRIKHRSRIADEIELFKMQSKDGVNFDVPPPARNLNGHPAVIALGFALRYDEIHWPQRMDRTMDDIFKNAETIEKWIIQKTSQP